MLNKKILKTIKPFANTAIVEVQSNLIKKNAVNNPLYFKGDIFSKKFQKSSGKKPRYTNNYILQVLFFLHKTNISITFLSFIYEVPDLTLRRWVKKYDYKVKLKEYQKSNGKLSIKQLPQLRFKQENRKKYPQALKDFALIFLKEVNFNFAVASHVCGVTTTTLRRWSKDCYGVTTKQPVSKKKTFLTSPVVKCAPIMGATMRFLFILKLQALMLTDCKVAFDFVCQHSKFFSTENLKNDSSSYLTGHFFKVLLDIDSRLKSISSEYSELHLVPKISEFDKTPNFVNEKFAHEFKNFLYKLAALLNVSDIEDAFKQISDKPNYDEALNSYLPCFNLLLINILECSLYKSGVDKNTFKEIKAQKNLGPDSRVENVIAVYLENRGMTIKIVEKVDTGDDSSITIVETADQEKPLAIMDNGQIQSRPIPDSTDAIENSRYGRTFIEVYKKKLPMSESDLDYIMNRFDNIPLELDPVAYSAILEDLKMEMIYISKPNNFKRWETLLYFILNHIVFETKRMEFLEAAREINPGQTEKDFNSAMKILWDEVLDFYRGQQNNCFINERLPLITKVSYFSLFVFELYSIMQFDENFYADVFFKLIVPKFIFMLRQLDTVDSEEENFTIPYQIMIQPLTSIFIIKLMDLTNSLIRCKSDAGVSIWWEQSSIDVLEDLQKYVEDLQKYVSEFTHDSKGLQDFSLFRKRLDYLAFSPHLAQVRHGFLLELELHFSKTGIHLNYDKSAGRIEFEGTTIINNSHDEVDFLIKLYEHFVSKIMGMRAGGVGKVLYDHLQQIKEKRKKLDEDPVNPAVMKEGIIITISNFFVMVTGEAIQIQLDRFKHLLTEAEIEEYKAASHRPDNIEAAIKLFDKIYEQEDAKKKN